MTIATRLEKVAIQRDLRRSTVLSYRRLLGRMDLLDRKRSEVTKEDVEDALYRIDNPNTRRAAAIAVRAVLGIPVKIPKGIPRRYDLPDEATLRRALAHSPHEVRGLLMMYAGLRIGEACAITHGSVRLDGRLSVDRQVQQLHETGMPTITRVGAVKSGLAAIEIPPWLAERLREVTETAKPDCVRESLRRAGAKEGVRLNPHQLRHWYGSYLLDKGAPWRLVQNQMRHSDIATTHAVYHDYDADKVMKRIFGDTDPYAPDEEVA
jgi:integrase